MLSMIPLYIYIYIFFDISFFLRDHNGNKAMQLFCAIPVTIDFLIVFRNFFIYLYDDKINLPTYLPTYHSKFSVTVLQTFKI